MRNAAVGKAGLLPQVAVRNYRSLSPAMEMVLEPPVPESLLVLQQVLALVLPQV